MFGWTTGATTYFEAAPASGHKAVATGWDANLYRLEVTDPASSATFRLFEDYVRYHGIQTRVIYGSLSRHVFNVNNISATNNDIRIYDCYIRGDVDVSSNSRGIDVGDSDAIMSVWNNIIIDCDHSGIFSTGPTNNIYNNTIYNCATAGIWGAGASNWDIQGNAVFVCGDDFLDGTSGTWSLNYNASDDGDGTNPQTLDATGTPAYDTEFTNAAGGDFSVPVGSIVIGNAAVDPGSGLFADDIAGTTRGAAWDVGAFEFVAAGGGIVVLRRRRQ